METNNRLFIEAEAVFLPPQISGRQILPSLRTGMYRPHIRAKGQGELLGIIFIDGPTDFTSGEVIQVKLGAVYHPLVNYSSLKTGVQFTVVEGYRIVAVGQVTKTYDE